MAFAEIRDGFGAPRHPPALREQRSMKGRLREIWSRFVVGLGLLATLAWIALLGWLVYHTILVLLS